MRRTMPCTHMLLLLGVYVGAGWLAGDPSATRNHVVQI